MRPFILLLPVVYLTHIASPSLAVVPCVQFDVVRTVPVEDVSADTALAELHLRGTNEKLVRLRLHVSSLVQLEHEDTLVQFLYVVSGRKMPIQIVDFAPKTKLASEVVGNVTVERSRGESSNIGLRAQLPRDVVVKGDATANHGTDKNELIRFEQLPSLHVVTSSGTMDRGRAVYFKQRPSTRHTLEGDKTFEFVARVPESWRAGFLEVQCQAFRRARGFLPHLEHNEDLVCGERRFLVGAYLSGDALAKRNVEDLIRRRSKLRNLAIAHATDVKEGRFPHWKDKLGAALLVTKPKIPHRWLEFILASDGSQPFEQHLPHPLQTAAREYRAAKRKVDRLAG